jgi:hypothetical protein
MSGHFHVPPVYPRYPLRSRLCRAQCRSGRYEKEKNFAPVVNRTPISSPVVRRYTAQLHFRSISKIYSLNFLSKRTTLRSSDESFLNEIVINIEQGTRFNYLGRIVSYRIYV